MKSIRVVWLLRGGVLAVFALILILSLGQVVEERAHAGIFEADMAVLFAQAQNVPTKVVIGDVANITLEAVFVNEGPDKNTLVGYTLAVLHPPELKITPDNEPLGAGPFQPIVDVFGFPIPATLECNAKGTFGFTVIATIDFTDPFDPNPNNDFASSPTYLVKCNNPSNQVGGIAELPEVAGTPLETAGSLGSNTGLLAGVVAAIAAGTVTLGGAAWYARRRCVR